MKARTAGRGPDVGREPPAAPGSRPDRRLGFVRARRLQRGSVWLPAACSPPPLAPPPGLQLLFNIHLEELNLASWKPAHSQIPGDFQSLSFSPARDAMLRFLWLERFKSLVPACLPRLPCAAGALQPTPTPGLAPRRQAATEGSGAPAPTSPAELPVAARCPVSGGGDTGHWPSHPGQWGVRGRREGDFLEGPTCS